MKKRVLSVIIVLMIIIGILPYTPVPVQAAGATLSQLESKYPHGKYWNGGNADSYTSNPCTHHGNCSKNGTDYSGWCGCNSYKGKAIQCNGFAYQLAYLVYGGDPYANWVPNRNASALDSLKAGDIVRYQNGGHSIFVIGVSGDTVMYADCNSDGHCKIRWNQTVSKSTLRSSFTYVDSAPYEWNTGITHTHSYTGYHWEAAHPHRCYKQCSCGETKYIEDEYYTYTDGTCSSCSMVQDSKYSKVKGFKSYPCVSSNFEVKTSDLSTRGGEIYTTDFCTINEIYTNGWCKVTFPMDSGGTRTAYTQISKFIKTPSASLTKYTAKNYINLYSTSSRSTQIYRIYPDDVCYTIGTSGSSTQIFMPHTDGYYVLGWVATSDLPPTPPPASEKLNPGLTSLSPSSPAKCYTISNSRYSVYTSSALTTRGYEGTASSTAWTGESDEIWIIGVGVNSSGTAYAKIKYPIGDSRYTAYVPLHSTLVPGSLTGSYRTAVAKVTGFSDRPGGSTNSSYWVDPGEKVYLLSQQSGYSQILYPTSSGGWRIAWCTDSMYNSMFKAQTYTVKYNANGGTGAPNDQIKTHDVDLTLSSTKPKKDGHTFVGWATSSTATSAKYSAGSIYSSNSSVTLYAVWRKQSFTITYNANGGANAPGAQTQTYGTAITVTSAKPEKYYTVTFNANGGTVGTSSYSLDCTFASWNTNKSGTETTVKSGASYTPNANVTLYAIYSNPTLGNYPIPYKEGYTFDGWYTAASGGTKVTTSTVISANTTLYAHWNLEEYSVIYYDDGSSNIPVEQTKIYGTALTLSSTVPIKDGYTFKGWATEEGSTTVVYSPGTQYTDNDWVILYAVWEKNIPTLSEISISSLPEKTEYIEGENLDTTGLNLKLVYSDDSTETITSGFTVTGYDSSKIGMQSVYVSYGGKTTKFTVVVEERINLSPKYNLTSATGVPGDTIEISLSILDNSGIISLRNTISYDENALELVKVENTGLLSGFTTPSPAISSPYVLRWSDSLALENNEESGVIAKLTFAIKDTASEGEYDISVDHIEARTANGELVEFESAEATIKCEVSKEPGTSEPSNPDISEPTIPDDECILGDANEDGAVNIKDATSIQKHIASLISLSEYGYNVSDVDGSGNVNIKDATAIQKHIAGMETGFPIGVSLIVSNWVKETDVPEGAQILNEKWSYILSEYKTSSEASLPGYTLYNTKQTDWGVTQGPVYVEPSDNTYNVWSEEYENKTHYYRYYRYSNPNNNLGSDVESSIYTDYEYIDLTAKLTEKGSMGNTQGYKWYYNDTNYKTMWFESEWDDVQYDTRWYYQEPVYTYYYYRDLSMEATIDPTGQANVSNVVKWVQYRTK